MNWLTALPHPYELRSLIATVVAIVATVVFVRWTGRRKP